MKKPNPKIHDSLLKWLIAAFTVEFFAYYFPNITMLPQPSVSIISMREKMRVSLREKSKPLKNCINMAC